MPSYQDTPLVFFDIETTGLRPGHHEVTEVAFIHEKLGAYCVRVNPRFPDRFEEDARRISRYNEVEWAGTPDLSEVMMKIREYTYESIIVGHNIVGFDIPFLNGNCKMIEDNFEIPMKMNAIIDTQMMALSMLVPRGLKTLSLNACCKFFGISNEGQHHGYDDCLRTKMVYETMMKKFIYDDGKSGQRELWQ